MTTFASGTTHRLLQDMATWLTDPNTDFTYEFKVLAARAQQLVANDSLSQAMVGAKLDGTHGPRGLRRKSLAEHERDTVATPDEQGQRKTVENWLKASSGLTFTTTRMLTRRQAERAVDWMATVLGEGYAVRVWKPRKGVKHATTWRLIRPERVSNPDDRPNDDLLYHGLEFDAQGELVAIHFENGNTGPFGTRSARTWTRVPMRADDGTPNVLRRTGLLLPGMHRAVSMFAPLLLLVRQLQGVVESHVTTKRAQACAPVIVYTDDLDELKKAEEANAAITPFITFAPLKVVFARTGNTVNWPQIQYNGQDLKDFLATCYRLCSAAWGMPVEVVLCQMGEASLSSARAGLDQFDRTCQTYQQDHIEQFSEPCDEAEIREGVLRGEIEVGEEGIEGLLCGEYQRPPKYSTDRKKDADTLGVMVANRVSPSTAFGMIGLNFEDEIEQGARDEAFAALHGVKKPTPPDAKAAAPAPDPAAPPDVAPGDDEDDQNPIPQPEAA